MNGDAATAPHTSDTDTLGKDAASPRIPGNTGLVLQFMDSLLTRQARDPAFFSSLPSPPWLRLEKDTPSGGKFWSCTIQEHGIDLHWGKLNTQGQRLALAITRCNRGSPIREARSRVFGKLKEGYRLVSSYGPLP